MEIGSILLTYYSSCFSADFSEVFKYFFKSLVWVDICKSALELQTCDYLNCILFIKELR